MKKKRKVPLLPVVSMALVGTAAIVCVVLSAISGSLRGARETTAPGGKVAMGDTVLALVDPKTRAAEVKRLVDSESVEAVPILRGFTKDEDPELRRLCVWALGELGVQESVHALRIRTGDRDPRVRIETARAFGKLFDRTAYEGLKDMLADEELSVRMTAVGAFTVVLPHALAVDGLAMALDDPDPAVRVAVVEGLGSRDHPSYLSCLIKAAADTNTPVRVAAVTALSARRGASAIAALARAVVDDSPDVRSPAHAAASQIREPLLPHLARVLPSVRTSDVRREVLDLLKEIGGLATVRCLIALLESGQDGPDTAAFAPEVSELLVSLGEEVIPALDEEGIRGGCGLVAKRAVAAACVRLGKPAVEPIVQSILRWKLFPDEEELKIWVRTLGEIGDPAAVPALRRALAADVKDIAELVAGAVRSIGAKSGNELPPLTAEAVNADAESAAEPAYRPDPGLSAPVSADHTGFPSNAVVRMRLKDALLRGYARQRSAADLDLTLTREQGGWRKEVLGLARRFNQSDHEGVLTQSRSGRASSMSVEMVIHDDPWVRGGFGEYRIELAYDGEWFEGSYTGRYDYQDVGGPVWVTAVEPFRPAAKGTAPPLQSGEHPRALFRKHQLPKLLARAETDLGRKIIRILRDRAGGERRAGGTRSIDLAIGCAFLYSLYGDETYGRMAVPAINDGVDSPGGGHAHDTAYKLINVALAYDLAYNCLTGAERKKFTEHLASVGNIISHWGLAGNFNNGPNSNWTAIGCGGAGLAALAVLREKGRIGLSPPMKQDPVFDITPDSDAGTPPGVPVGDFRGGKMMRKWLVNGPFRAAPGVDLLVPLGGSAKADPREGTMVFFDGHEYPFMRMPEDAVRETPGLGRCREAIFLPAARADTRTLLYKLLKVDRVTGAGFECAFPAGFRSANIWISGRKIPNRSVLILRPGVHRILLDVTGPVAAPALFPVNAHFLYGQYQRYLQLQKKWQNAKDYHDRTGEMQDVVLKLRIASMNTLRWWDRSLGDHGWGTECGYEHAYGCLAPYTMAHETATGESLCDTPGFGWMIPLEMISRHGLGLAMVKTTQPAYVMHRTTPDLMPAVIWEFNRRYLPDNLVKMGCKELAFAFVNYPLDVEPRPPEEVLPRVLEDKRKGGYVFRSSFDRGDGDILAAVFFSSEKARGPCYFYPQAGTFRITGLGVNWAVGRPQNKRQSKYQAENVVFVEGDRGGGAGKVKYFVRKPDGSGIVGADMSGVYAGDSARAGDNYRVKAERHFAVDYGGKSGAPALFAMVDRLDGGPGKTWLMHPGGVGRGHGAKPLQVTVEDGSFTMQAANGATLSGRVVSPPDARVSMGAVKAMLRRTRRTPDGRNINVVEEATVSSRTLKAVVSGQEADYFVVWTIQPGPPPEIETTGDGLNAVVRIGEQEVSFKDGRLVLKEW